MSDGPSGFFAAITTSVAPEPYNNMNVYVIQNSATSTSNNIITANGTSLTLSTSVLATSYRTDSVQYMINTGFYNTGADICEILLYVGEITTSQRQQLEGYLAWKWGLQANLPSGHTYYSAPPAPP